MRFLVGVLLALTLAPAVRAQDEAPDDASVQRWIRWLGDPNPRRRRIAYSRLARAGETVVPALMAVKTENADVARAIRSLTRAARKVRLSILGPKAAHAVGTTLQLRLELYNDTDDQYTIPFQQHYDSALRACFTVMAGRRRFSLRPHQVRGIGANLILKPGETKYVTVRFEAASGFVSGPGRLNVRWRFYARYVPIGTDGDSRRLSLESNVVTVHAIVRTVAQLRKALDGGRAERDSALAELSARSDRAVLPVFRERFRDPDVAPLAVRAFGVAGEEQDLAILIPATTTHPSREVRLGAVRALGKFPKSGKARRRLTRLVVNHDEELLAEAAEALAGHKHASTVGAYINLLRRRGPWQRKVAQRLRVWTGIPVSLRKSEIDAFEMWFFRQRKLGKPWAISERRK